MRAIVIREPGGPEVLEPREVATPAPSADEVRVRVRATAVNRADLLQRLGRYPAPPGAPADVPGLELAGEIDAIGGAVRGWQVGDRCFGLVPGGAYAEYVVTDARALARLDPSLDFPVAAAIPEAFLTAYDALIDQAQLRPGETLLVHAAASAVGIAGVQLGHLAGARVLGTTRSADKQQKLEALGVDAALLVESARFADAALARTGRAGADVVFDLVGGGYVNEDLACLAPRGRIVVAGTLDGSRADLDLGTLLAKRAVVRGTVLRSRGLDERIALARTLERRLQPLFVSGALRAVVDRSLALADAPEAHRIVASNATFGKVVLTGV